MDGKYAIAVDIGATWMRVAIGDEEGRILKKLSERTKREGKSGKVIADQVLSLISSLIGKIDVGDIEGIGIGSIGPLDLEEGAIVNSPNLPFEYVPLIGPIRSKLKLPIYLINDCTAAVIGEREFGAGKGVDDLVYIGLGTGIGGGVYVDGHLLFGKDRNAAEIGHITIDVEGRLRCGCGKFGHWEAYCSGANIPNFARLLLEGVSEEKVKSSLLFKLVEGQLANLSTKILFDVAEKGDDLSLKIVEKIGRFNAIGFANVINAYDPSLITVGGTLALENPDLIMRPIKKYVRDHTINRLPRIEITPLGKDITLYGAIAAVVRPLREIEPFGG
jgi:glucokinase